MTIRATHAPSAGGPGHRGPEAVRYNTAPYWPGIPANHPLTWCASCTRAWSAGRYVIKCVNTMCGVHGGYRTVPDG